MPYRWLQWSSSREEMLLLIFHHYLVRRHRGEERSGVLAFLSSNSRAAEAITGCQGFTEARRRHRSVERLSSSANIT
jgi:hypothetical protein